ncbi:MAG: glycoside hydrolase family 3 protein [Clostridia bacterium]|nr:glycoside hydrolase family 3 protein [Clostridia bacterium]
MKPDLRGNPFFLNDSQIEWVHTTLDSMSTEDKLHHLFCLVLYNDDEATCRYLAETIRPGGFMNRSMPAEQCIRSIERMQELSRIPLLVAANLEAGGNGIVKSGTRLGNSMQVAATKDPEFARKLGEVCGVEGSAVGANFSFAPVIDIDYNWRNPVTNVRTFGSDVDTVREMGVAYVKELQKHGVAATIKHFPGDGCDERDQHVSVSVNSLSREEWDQSYGSVYRACIEAGAKAVMVGHILQPAYTKHFTPDIPDGDILPASMSHQLITGLLRQRLGFNGLVITDSSAMIGLATHLPRETLVPLTIAAGCDMFLFTRNLEEDIAFMEKGYRDGIFGEERLNEAVTRILALKASLGLPEKQKKKALFTDPQAIANKLGTPLYRQWALDCARRSITLVKEEPGVFPITPERFPRILFCPLDSDGNNANEGTVNGNFKAELEQRGFRVTVFEPLKVTEGAMVSVDEMVSRYDLILYSASVKGNYQPNIRITWSKPQGCNVPSLCHTIPTVFVSFANPYHLIDVPHVRTFINCYAGTKPVLDALMEKLSGKDTFTGVSPSDPFCGKWDAHVSFGPACRGLENK